MILHSTRPAVFVLAMDDCEVQASSGGLPNFCSVLWKNSDGPEALAQVWAFLVFPIVGGLLAGFLFKPMFDRTKALTA